MSIHPDYYEILNVAPNADDDAIRRSFRRLAFEWHPDRRPGDANAAAHMRLLNEAYETISNPLTRRDYDLTRAGPSAKGADRTGQPSEARDQDENPDFQRTQTSERESPRDYPDFAANGSSETPTHPRRSTSRFTFLRLLLSFTLVLPLKLFAKHPVAFTMVIWWAYCTSGISFMDADKAKGHRQKVAGDRPRAGNERGKADKWTAWWRAWLGQKHGK